MGGSVKKSKPTLESLVAESQVITGKELIKRRKEEERQKVVLQEAIEFEKRNRKARAK